jgi:hypothetical protein
MWSCQDACQMCETSCEISCQAGCQICQTGCEISCQLCQTQCQGGCQVACQFACQIYCQSGCQVCETGCEVSCQECQSSCETCNTSCQYGCEVCEDTCMVACMLCQAVCVGCQVACQVICQTGCEVNCQTCSEVGCQGCQIGCQSEQMDFNCNLNANPAGGRGITIWGPTTISLGSYVEQSLNFTLTQPRCHQGGRVTRPYGEQAIIVAYTIHTDDPSTNDDVGPITFVLNDDTGHASPHYHSKTAGHDLTEAFDWVNGGATLIPGYNGYNTLKVTNGSSIPVTLQGFKIIRVYAMCALSSDTTNPSQCTDSTPACLGCQSSYPLNTSQDFTTCQDYPCNKDDGRLSFTKFGPFGNQTVEPGDTVSWSWQNPTNTIGNYHGRKSCLFNFNNVQLSDNTNANDVHLQLKVNNSDWVDFWQTKKRQVNGTFHNAAHSVDLATHPILGAIGYNGIPIGYNDAPSAVNTLYLHLDESANVNLTTVDSGGVDIYRVYETGCQSCESCETCNICVSCQICYGFCFASCYAECVVCATGCQTSCQTRCEICEAECETSCQSCEVGCEISCQTGCELCETGCEVSCETCETTCQAGCELCETGCEVSCQVSCQTGCQISCQSECETACQDCQACETGQ